MDENKTHTTNLKNAGPDPGRRYDVLDSPLGDLLVTGHRSASAPGGVVVASLRPATSDPVPGAWRDTALFAPIARQLREYFAGARREFDVAFADQVFGDHGTAFQRRVWRAVEEIGYGTTTTYGTLAAELGVARDRIRAVGAAVGANPVMILRPCHRVIGANGALTGYAWGLEAKRFLLTLEGALQPMLV